MNKQQYTQEFEARRADRAENAVWSTNKKHSLPERKKSKPAQGKYKITKYDDGYIIKLY